MVVAQERVQRLAVGLDAIGPIAEALILGDELRRGKGRGESP